MVQDTLEVSPSGLRRYPMWLILAAGGAITAISLGARSTFGLYLVDVSDTIGSGLGAVSFAIALQNIIWGFSQPIAGAISDRFGAARVLATGGVLWFLAMVATSMASNIAVFTLSAGVLAGLAVGAASFSVVLSSVGRMVAEERRSMALGIVSAVGSLGQFVMVPLASFMLGRWTWQTTTVVVGIISLSCLIGTPVLRGKASDFMTRAATADVAEAVPLRDDLRRAARSRSYLLVNAGFLVCGFHVTFIGTHLPAYVEDVGLAASVGAWALALIGLFNVGGSLGAGFLGGRYSKTHLLAGIYGMRGVVIAGYVLVPVSGASTIVFGALIGTLWLATVPLTSGMVTSMFGTANSGALFGIVFLSHQVGSFIGAWLGGVLADATGSYNVMWWLAVVLGVVGFGVHMLADDRPVPQNPVVARTVGLAPAVWLAVVGLGATACLFTTADAADTDSVAPRWCTLIIDWDVETAAAGAGG